MSGDGTNEPGPLEVEGSTAGASGADDLGFKVDATEFISALAMRFCAEPEGFPVFQRWCSHHCEPPSEYQELFATMEPAFLEVMAQSLLEGIALRKGWIKE